jgi:citrate synthase
MDAKAGSNTKSATLKVGDKDYSFKVYDGTIGPSVMDIGKLYSQTGIFTYDPGYTSTGSCESKITYIDGDEGVLLYRGYPSTATSSRPAICCSTASCRRRRKRSTSTIA